MPTVEERAATGRAMRGVVPRSPHADCARDESFDPVDLILSQEAGRLEDLIPIRRVRMVQNAFAFFRAGTLLMASIAEFAVAYADKNDRDFTAYLERVKSESDAPA